MPETNKTHGFPDRSEAGREVGGDFEMEDAVASWDRRAPDRGPAAGGGAEEPLPASALVRHLPPDWREATVRWYSSGRMGLRAVLRAAPRGVFLVPSYLCEATLRAFRGEGYPLRFYPIRPGLRVDEADVRGLWTRGGRKIRGILAIEYFGFELDPGFRSVLGEMAGAGLTVVQDITHSFPSAAAEARWFGTHVLCSVRKTLPVPDGAFVLARTRPPKPPSLPAGPYVEAKRRAQVEKARYLARVRSGGADPRGLRPPGRHGYLGRLRRAEAGFDADPEIRAMSEASRLLLPRLDLRGVATRRAANFARLARAIQPNPGLVEPLRSGVEQAMAGGPLGFPLVASRRDELRDYLVRRAIFPPVHWYLPWEAAAWAKDHNPYALELSASELTLPCDQRYNGDDMDRVGAAVNDYLRELGGLGRNGGAD